VHAPSPWGRVVGAALAFALALQATTGILLASFYAPSSTTAWAAVAYIQQEVSYGWLVRGLHSAGASMIVVLLLAHLVQTIWRGAHATEPRANWWLGLALLGIVLTFALTGYLLPWDQKGYWATQVATSLVGETPLVGDFLRRLLQGGNDYGNLTLTHFYALHTILLPALLATLVVAHVRRARRDGDWWPDQAWRDVVAMALVVAALYAVVLPTHGAPLEAPADPSSAYDARPEWYFLPLFQLLKYMSGRFEVVAALGVPLVVGALLAYVPWLPKRAALSVIAGILVAALGLGLLARRDDARSTVFQRNRARADAEAKRALALARLGVPPAGGVAVYENDPVARARTLFAARCAGCHVLGAVGEPRGPLLTRWSSRAWLADFLQRPDDPDYFGRTKKLHQMKPVKPVGDELTALVEFVYSRGGGRFDGARAVAGEAIFKRENCDECHDSDGKTAGDGVPNLGGRASDAWIEQLIRDAGGALFFDGKSEMPKFGPDKLSDDDVRALVAMLRAERGD
jgi:ubiquinol-cytochrome c reductase cytochrome b subunit